MYLYMHMHMYMYMCMYRTHINARKLIKLHEC